MKKYSVLPIFGIFFLAFVSAMTFQGTLTTSTTNYTSYIENQITCNKIYVDSNLIEIDGLNGGGYFNNTGSSTTILNFINTVSPYLNFTYSNGTIIDDNATNINVTIPSGLALNVTRNQNITTPTPPPGGGSTTPSSYIYDLKIITSTEWKIGSTNDLFFIVKDNKGEFVDIDKYSVSFSEPILYEESFKKSSEGQYLLEYFLPVQDLEQVTITLIVEKENRVLEESVVLNLKEANFLNKEFVYAEDKRIEVKMLLLIGILFLILLIMIILIVKKSSRRINY